MKQKAHILTLVLTGLTILANARPTEDLPSLRNQVIDAERTVSASFNLKQAALIARYEKQLASYRGTLTKSGRDVDLDWLEQERVLLKKDPYFRKDANAKAPDFLFKVRTVFVDYTRELEQEKRNQMLTLYLEYKDQVSQAQRSLAQIKQLKEVDRMLAELRS